MKEKLEKLKMELAFRYINVCNWVREHPGESFTLATMAVGLIADVIRSKKIDEQKKLLKETQNMLDEAREMAEEKEEKIVRVYTF